MTNPDTNIIPLPKGSAKPVWLKAKFSNLRKYVPTGTYHCHATVCGKLVRRSLKTKSETIAKLKLDKLLEQERKRLAKAPVGEMTFRTLATEFMSRLEANPDIKDTTRKYRTEALKSIRAVWAGLDDLTPQRIAPEECARAAAKLRPKYSPTRYNGTLETLRAVLQLGVELGCIAENPLTFANKRKGVRGIPRAKVVPKDWQLPERKEFNTLVQRLNALPSRLRASRTVRFIAFSGLRIGAARLVMPSDVDLERNCLSKPKFKYSDSATRLPMFKELRKVCEELLADYPGEGPLLPIKNPRRALRNSCAECGIARLNNHAMRHLFATRCLESGVDIRCLADWLDHRDNGALLLKRYAHVIDGHSQRMSRKVRF